MPAKIPNWRLCMLLHAQKFNPPECSKTCEAAPKCLPFSRQPTQSEGWTPPPLTQTLTLTLNLNLTDSVQLKRHDPATLPPTFDVGNKAVQAALPTP